MITLRDYQKQMLDEARAQMRAGARRVLLVAPTGSGKRMMAVFTISQAVARGKRCCFLVHRKELLDQSSETLSQAAVRHGIIKAGVRPDYDWVCQVASVQSLVNRANEAGKFDFIFTDEAHHSRASTWERIIAEHPGAYVLGFTATPLRLDGKGLKSQFDAMVVGPGVRELINQGYLADYRIFAPPEAMDLSQIRTIAGDYNQSELAQLVEKPTIVGDVVSHYQRHTPGTQAICFAVTIRHSQLLAAAFNEAGISAIHTDCETPRDEREMILTDFAKRRFRVLCNVDILGEGLDVAGIETVICARPTQSLTIYLQQVGRGLRVKPDGKRCVILDHAGNSSRHGMPDELREWELTDDRIKKRAPSEVPVKTCPVCFAVINQVDTECPECGHEFKGKKRNTAHEDGELEEVDIAAVAERRQREQYELFLAKERSKRELSAAKTFDDLVALGMRRGYRYPSGWARKILEGRQRYRERQGWV